MNTHWVLRDAITGQPFATENKRPDDYGFPVIMDERECYWTEEPLPRPFRASLLFVNASWSGGFHEEQVPGWFASYEDAHASGMAAAEGRLDADGAPPMVHVRKAAL